MESHKRTHTLANSKYVSSQSPEMSAYILITLIANISLDTDLDFQLLLFYIHVYMYELKVQMNGISPSSYGTTLSITI